MAQDWEDLEDDVNDFDESQAGPEYWMHKREFAKRKLSQCVKCGVKQLLAINDNGAYAVCPSKLCAYRELIIEWKV